MINLKNKIDSFFISLLNSKYSILIFFIVCIKPYFMYKNSYINLICNIIFFSLIIIIYYVNFFNKKKVSKFQYALLTYLAIILIPTIFISKDYSAWVKMFLKFTSVSLYSEYLIKHNLLYFFKYASYSFALLIILTFITTIIFPNGIFGTDMILLGYDNETVVIMLMGSMFIWIANYYQYITKHERIYYYTGYLALIMTFVVYLIRWSVGALIGCFVIFLFLLLYYLKRKFNIFKKIHSFFSAKRLYILSFILFILIVVLGVQKYFSFIIVDILHKDLTLSGRVTIWNNYIGLIKDNLLIGIGYSTNRILFDAYHSHNQFLNVILESGLLGLVLYFRLWFKSLKSIDNNSNDNFLIFLIKITLFSYLIFTLVDMIHSSELIYVILVLGYYSPFISNSMNKEKNNKRKILFLIDSGQPIPAFNGGAIETLVDSLLSNNEDANIDVISISNHVNFYKNNIHYNYINYSFIIKFILKCYNYLRRKLLNMNNYCIFSTDVYDYLESNNKLSYYNYLIIENSPDIILKLKNKVDSKFILHLHNDYNVLCFNYKSLSYYDKIICCSKYIAKRYQTICENKNIECVYNGVNTNQLLKYKNDKEKIRNDLNIPINKFVFGYCGRICEDKGTIEVIQSFIEIYKKNKSVCLLITGNSSFNNSRITPYVEKVISLISKYKECIIFTGYLDHGYIGKFYTAIDCFVQASKVNEACPLTIIEANVNNKMVVSTNSGGIPEIVKKENILIPQDFKNNDLYLAMKKVISNKHIYKQDDYIMKFSDTTFCKNFWHTVFK